MSRDYKPYKIIGAYDSETTNIEIHGEKIAFPILHQLGFIDGCNLEDITSENVEKAVNVEMFRHSLDLYERLDSLTGNEFEFVPVILCHNLAFDMYGLSIWLKRHDVRVLAKSARKPITFTILDDAKKPRLVIWDTLIFTQQSLERMGEDCGYSKAIGEWDYNLIRTPETPLSNDEIDYAERDIYTLLAWLSWWIRRNPDIELEKLGLNVVTKTGIVRERRRVRFDQLKGNGLAYNVGRYWLYRCRMEQPKTDDELFTMFAATRGGFTFCASANASIPFDCSDDEVIAAFDATSQHPAQLVSKYYPICFKERNARVLELAFNLIGKYSLQHVLDHLEKPFNVAFYACFEFVNLRPKSGSIFEKWGILPLASARYKTPEQLAQLAYYDDDNGDKASYREYMGKREYKDTAVNAKCAFGKLVSADVARLYITELTAWEIWQCYEWDSVSAVHGYETGRFTKPSDMDVISVMQFYKAKNEFKKAREQFYSTGTITNADELINLGIAPAIAQGMRDGTISAGDVEATYLGLKADLNAIFGISCSNQYRRQTVLDDTGIEYVGEFGICNKPKNPKVWYQFGQRIVGYSRIAQVIILLLAAKHVKTCINGDTDSCKFLIDKSKLPALENELKRYSDAIDKAKVKVCNRVKYAYPRQYDPLNGIGHYVLEFNTDRFCASWNKAYCTQDVGKDGKRHFSFTLAGIPTRRRENKNQCFIGLNGYADWLYSLGYTFAQICNLFLGYNVTFANDVIKLNGRKFPEWGETVFEKITDYKGETATVAEPRALALYPMTKTVNDTKSPENAVNMAYAVSNNAFVNTTRKLVCSSAIIDIDDLNLGAVFNG